MLSSAATFGFFMSIGSVSTNGHSYPGMVWLTDQDRNRTSPQVIRTDSPYSLNDAAFVTTGATTSAYSHMLAHRYRVLESVRGQRANNPIEVEVKAL
jgi:hypothetical protein